MPQVATATDENTLVGGVQIKSGSPNVFVKGKPVARVTDPVIPHLVGIHRNPIMIEGSPNVFVNGLAMCREGDRANCDHPAIVSDVIDVFAN